MEFLMTYGWALLVILLVIAALAYFGMLNPDRFLPDKVSVSDNRIQIVETGTNRLILKNVGGDTFSNLKLNMTNHNCLESNPITLAPGEIKNYVLQCSDVPTKNSKLRGDIKITYSTSTYGEIVTKIANANYAVSGNYFSSRDLVGYWPFEDNWNDYSGYGNNADPASCTPNCPTFTAGKVGKGFVTSSSGINVPDSSSLDLANSLTLSVWVKVSSLDSLKTFIFKDQEYWLRQDNSLILDISNVWVYLSGGWEPRASGATTLAVGRWYHVAATWDGSTITLYLNGVKESSSPRTGTVSPTTNVVSIGTNVAGTYIDEAMIFKRALSSDEIKALYEMGK
jgi:hypothetical protein